MTASAAPAKKAYGLRETIAALGQPRVASMFALGFASGLPFLLTGATFGYWLRDEGTTLTAIGFLSWVGLAYTFKVFWAPLMDRVPAPLFGRLGQRRGWAVFAQVLVAIGLVAMALVGVHGPGGLAAIGGFALLVAFASATQDAAVDAWRIESATDPDDLGVITSAFQLGYRIALLVTDALILIFAQFLGWPLSYGLMALLMGAGLFASLRTPEPPRTEPALRQDATQVSSVTPAQRTMIGAGLFVLAAAWMYWRTHGGLVVGEGPVYAATLGGFFALAFGGGAWAGGLRWQTSVGVALGVFAAATALTWLIAHPDAAAKVDPARAASFGAVFGLIFLACAGAALARATSAAWIGGAIAAAAMVLTAFYSTIVEVDHIGGARIFWPGTVCLAAAAIVAPPRIFGAIVGPFIDFFRAHGWFAAVMLLMISLYRLPEFVIGPVAGPFYHDLGFEKSVVGSVRGTAGLIGATLGIAAGGLCVLRLGLKRSLILGAILQALGVAAYALLAFHAPDLRLFGFVMASDNFAYAFAGVAFVAYMSGLTSIGYTATQYALMSSTYTLFGKVLKGFSGAVVDGLQKTHTLMESYGLFYIGAGLIGIPGLLLCLVIVLRRSPEPAPAAA